MKCTTILALAATIISTAEGINLRKRTDGAPRVVGMETQRKPVTNPHKRDQLRKRGTVTANLDNEETLYFINATLGTPAQSLRLHLDTGSSDLWVNTASSTLCSQKSQPCSFSGTYDANSSSTYEYVGSWFNISYVDGSGASGDYVTDNITVGGTTLTDFQFGIGYTSSSSQGILGIGYAVNEVQVGRAQLAAYENLPAKMAASGAIASNAYSLWLNDLDANTGQILFGGVDTDQFTGELYTLPVQREGSLYAEFLITLTGVSLGDTTIAENQALPVLLDSGSSLTYLPDSMVETIYKKVSAEYDSTEGVAYVACSVADDTDTSVNFNFTEPVISVAMNELVLDVYTSTGKRPQFTDGTEACLFGIAPAGSSTTVLGDTFLRSAYVVYDLANNEISLAQTNFNATSSNVLEIGSGTDAVPSATDVADAVAATGIGEATSTQGGFSLLSSASPRTNAGGSVGLAAFVAVALGLGMAIF
ncbi:putative aspartic-type endopeptidase OPSB [Cytospora mali]|uniref:Probable aspartic-type endopeptidase OPSB n=1 Tax=Cytospora mali TaxID=578113 RepID=A0A194VHD9_CYTMA|nr:putative aspartic-type endopeptidase OPSB [Valsa mali var. pyri (nom. inval.)]